MVEEDYFPVSHRFLLESDIEQFSLLTYVHKKTGLQPTKFEDCFRIAPATNQYADLLNCSPGHALLEVTQNVMTSDETLIYINQQYILSERYVYAVRSYR
ncbi:UTRA domain-containing protein [Anaerostipes caccae]|uniref:UTRA domain-containing protein n=1 Tax=Anaerostipes caccae TaxID=105841 RepID=UPI0038D459CD